MRLPLLAAIMPKDDDETKAAAFAGTRTSPIYRPDIDEAPPTCGQRKGRSGGAPSEKADYPPAPNSRRRLRARNLHSNARLERP